MTTIVKDHRVFERFSARFPTKYEYSPKDYGSNVFLRDASAQGVKIATQEKLFKNDHVTLLVKLPDGFDPLTLHGQVMWTEEKSPQLWEAGIRFHKVNLMEIQRLFKFTLS
jgi:hypothetical protein